MKRAIAVLFCLCLLPMANAASIKSTNRADVGFPAQISMLRVLSVSLAENDKADVKLVQWQPEVIQPEQEIPKPPCSEEVCPEQACPQEGCCGKCEQPCPESGCICPGCGCPCDPQSCPCPASGGCCGKSFSVDVELDLSVKGDSHLYSLFLSSQFVSLWQKSGKVTKVARTDAHLSGPTEYPRIPSRSFEQAN